MTTYPQEFLDLLKPSTRLRLEYGPNNPSNASYEVRAVVDAEQVVLRSWSERRGWWYRLVEVSFLFLVWEKKHLWRIP